MNNGSVNNYLHESVAHYYICLITIISTLVLLVFFCCFAIIVGICYQRNRKEARQKRKRKEHRRAERENRKSSYWSKRYAENSPHYEYWQQQMRDNQSSKQGLPLNFREMFRKGSTKPTFTINTPAIFAPISTKSRRGSYEIE